MPCHAHPHLLPADVKPNSLRPALDRFAQFFIAPLIKADALGREVQAVDNEFSGVLQSDACRAMQLRCHTARKGHLFSKFGWGNAKSLVKDPAAAGIDVRAQLLQYYK
jgi:nardilysin